MLAQIASGAVFRPAGRDPRTRKTGTMGRRRRPIFRFRSLGFTAELIETFLALGHEDQRRFVKALRLLDAEEKHPSYASTISGAVLRAPGRRAPRTTRGSRSCAMPAKSCWCGARAIAADRQLTPPV
jgi:hypothetical protein